MARDDSITVEVAYALPGRQRIVEVRVGHGGTAIEAVRLSGIDRYFPEIEFDGCDLGIFGKKTAHDHILVDGDRVEIYRPLKADPREVRRELASQGKTMGGKPKRT